MTQEELATQSGVDQSTISKIERGIQGTSRRTPALARTLRVPLDWLASGTGDMMSMDPDRVSSTSPLADKAMLVQYGDVRSPFAPAQAALELPTVPIPRYVMERLALADDAAIGLVQADAAMEPAIGKGDEGVIDPSRRDPSSNSGRVYAIAIGTNVITRRIIANPIGPWRVSSDHPDKRLYPDVDATPGEMVIIGQVRWTGGMK